MLYVLFSLMSNESEDDIRSSVCHRSFSLKSEEGLVELILDSLLHILVASVNNML